MRPLSASIERISARASRICNSHRATARFCGCIEEPSMEDFAAGCDEQHRLSLDDDEFASMPELLQREQERRSLRGKDLASSSVGDLDYLHVSAASSSLVAAEPLMGTQCSAAALAQPAGLDDPGASAIAAEIMSELGFDVVDAAEEAVLRQENSADVLGSPMSGRMLRKRSKLVTHTERRRNRLAQTLQSQLKLRREILDWQEEEPGYVPARATMVRSTIVDEDIYSGVDLTDDLLHKVFSYLDDTSLCRAAIVCRQWRLASSHEDFWKVLNFEGRKVTSKQVRNLCHRYPNAIELNLKCKMVDDQLALDAIRGLRNLQTLSLGEGLYGDPFFAALSADCRCLRTLTISDAVLGIGGAQEIQIRHESLIKLHILKSRVLRVYVKCVNLEELSLRRTGVVATILYCPHLQRLDVSACHKLSDTGVRAAATACHDLLQLDISHCSYVSDETLREIALACSNLQYLDASYCPNICLEGVRMSMLVSMKLCHCEGITSASMAALAHCCMLEELSLDYCWLLTTVSLDLPRLRIISLSNCRKFSELTLRAPSLITINVRTCHALNRVDIVSTSLQKLSFSQQQGLAAMYLHCPALQEVDLTECDSLTNAICEVFSQGGGCPRLSSLILDSCEGLTAISLSSTSLIHLSLGGCRKVFTIDLTCPVLQRLQLDGCDHLSAAFLCPVGLRSLNLGICPHLTKLVIKADEMTALDLRGCGSLRHADITCPALQSLDASYCSQLGDDCLAATSDACPSIQSLVLASCPSVGAAGLLALRKLSGLTFLDLSYTFLTGLTPVYEACPQLEVLKLSACKYLANDALTALHGGKLLPSLQELDLSYGSLDRTAIEGLLADCLHLKHVSLNGCANMFDIDWPSVGGGELIECSTGDTHMVEYEDELDSAEEQAMDISTDRLLQTLNCVGCPNIKRVVIASSAGCSHLSSLNLSLSINIKEVRLACSNLISLNLSNCLSLMELKLDCPKLMSLCLHASGIEAKELEEAIRDCSLLETLDLRNCAKISASALIQIRAIRPGIKRLYNSLS